MSRIEEALRKARAGTVAGQGREERPAGAPAAAEPAAEVFHAPWTFQDDTAAAPAVDGGGTTVGGQPEAPAAAGAGVWDALAGDLDAATLVEKPGAAQEAARPAKGVPEAAAEAVAETPGQEATGAGPDAGTPPPALALFQGFNPALAERIVATPDIRPAFAEQYRKLASLLHHDQLQRNIKVVMVTSAVAGEGKTLTSVNLALTFSESYRRSVLLIDADLRRPTLHETFQVPNVTGLGDGLRAEQEQKLSLVQVSPRLTLLTAGRPDPDPMSGLTSDRMRRVIAEAAARFDWVIVDTPPIGLLPDANVLAAMADTSLLVIHAGRTPYPLVRRAVEAIGRDRIFGVVLNRAEREGTGGYDYYSYYDNYARGERER